MSTNWLSDKYLVIYEQNVFILCLLKIKSIERKVLHSLIAISITDISVLDRWQSVLPNRILIIIKQHEY